LPNFKRLLDVGKSSVITLQEKPISASVWCSMFSGKLPEEHQHESFVNVKNGEIVKREDIPVDFIWTF
jgi:predicted AlkP superfamily phosphohydrolase/phosphomutase